MNLKKLPVGDKYPEEFNMIVEMPKNSHNKYEYDPELEVIKIDRVFYSAMALPYDYGFIPSTLSEDGDPLDGIIMLDEAAYPGILVVGRPIGVIYMVDSGEKDEKIICVPVDDPRYAHIMSVEDLGEHFKKELTHYFEHYKDLQGKTVQINSWGDKAAALVIMKEAQANFKG